MVTSPCHGSQAGATSQVAPCTRLAQVVGSLPAGKYASHPCLTVCCVATLKAGLCLQLEVVQVGQTLTMSPQCQSLKLANEPTKLSAVCPSLWRPPAFGWPTSSWHQF